MKQLIFAALAAALAASTFVTGAHAQSTELGPYITPAGALIFVRDDRDFVATLDRSVFDRFDAKTVTHYDDTAANGAIDRMLVQTDSGPVLYDFRRRPALVQRTNKRMVARRVMWQGEEVVMQTTLGWFRFQNGTLTKLQSATTVYH